MGEHQSADFSRRESSFSTASRMNAAMRFGPTIASMRCRCSSVRRTFVSFTFSGGRPMRAGVTVPEKFVKVIEKPSPLIDIISVPGYITGDGYKINGRTQMTTPLTAYLKGYHAGIACLGITLNPFAWGTENSNEWLRGYREGYRGYDEGYTE